MATIRDIAKRAGVSTSTVSHVINKTRHVREETRARVLEAMSELNYSPNRLAQSLRSRQTFTVGVLLPNSANPYFAEVLYGIEHTCFEHGYNVIIGNAGDDPKREVTYLKTLLSRQVDGILLISTGAYDDVQQQLKNYENTAVVLVDRPSQQKDYDEILTDNRQGGLLATHHLIELGHRRIGCIGGPVSLANSAERLAGYYAALDEAGITRDDALIRDGEFDYNSGYAAASHLLSLSNPPTAIFACNDLMAIGALCAAHEKGLRVPDDLSVIGYDDVTPASYSVPRLTTIAQPARDLGKLAVDRLVHRLQHMDESPQRDTLPVALVERDSCKELTQ